MCGRGKEGTKEDPAPGSNTSTPVSVPVEGGSVGIPASASASAAAHAPSFPASLSCKTEAVASSSSSVSAESSCNERDKEENKVEVMKKYLDFKRFDVVDDFSDHHYNKMGFEGQPPKFWSKKIQDEWKILEKDLPDTIYVRVYESRMDILRAVIVGPQGTPYHDGLFVFDVLFPPTYPDIPPTMVYTLRRPPKHFEDFVTGHFRAHAHDILSACRAYMDGAVVGSLVKGKIQDGGKKSTSPEFGAAIRRMINGLISNFTKIGAEDCEQFRCS
ncbi:putative ubiquitin-conjugating enzyme E2 38 [Forsythia ovata]|uniref:Ubiquitin-conjugating enzyme E2 38 n=1 Tax=Forsythia ovata TaxID=205694 RepID=A0ABD1P2T3_9LAMI